MRQFENFETSGQASAKKQSSSEKVINSEKESLESLFQKARGRVNGWGKKVKEYGNETLTEKKKSTGKKIGAVTGAALFMLGAAGAAQAETVVSEKIKSDKEISDVLSEIGESSRVLRPYDQLMKEINAAEWAKLNKEDSFVEQMYNAGDGYENSPSVDFSVSKDGGMVTFSGGNIEDLGKFPESLKKALTEIKESPVRFLGNQLLNYFASEESERLSNKYLYDDEQDRREDEFNQFREYGS